MASTNCSLPLNVFEKSVILKMVAICSQVRSLFLKVVRRMGLLEPALERDRNPYFFTEREICVRLYLAFIFVELKDKTRRTRLPSSNNLSIPMKSINYHTCPVFKEAF